MFLDNYVSLNKILYLWHPIPVINRSFVQIYGLSFEFMLLDLKSFLMPVLILPIMLFWQLILSLFFIATVNIFKFVSF